MPIMRKGKSVSGGSAKTLSPKRYQEGGRVRAGNPGLIAARRLAEQNAATPAVPEEAAAPELPMPPPPTPQRRRRARDPQAGMADDLNARVLYLTRGGVPRDDIDQRLASAMGLTFKKGGPVKASKK